LLVLDEKEIRALTNAATAHEVVEQAFRALHRGEATLPGVISVPFSAPEGVAHIKAGRLHTDSTWTVKVSTDFEPEDGGPTIHNGLMLVLSATDGAPVALLLDNGYLTDLRTGAAGAVAADLLARPDATTVAIVGAGSQARFQLDALLQVRQIESVRVAARSPERGQAFVDEIASRWKLPAVLSTSVEAAVRGADVVVTATSSTSALVRADWLEPGSHVTAVGSDEPTKQELDPDVLHRANVIAVDDRGQASRLGELHHAIEAGAAREVDAVTLGELLEQAAEGRATADDVTVADLTGVGVQDAAIAGLVLSEATRAGRVRS